MSIREYIEKQIEYLYSIGVYQKEKDKDRIESKKDKIIKILEDDEEYKNLPYNEIIKRIDALVNDAISKHLALLENNDEKRNFYSSITGIKGSGITLLEKESITTNEPLEIAYATIGSGSIHIHCGISRKIDYIDENGKEITHYHNLLRKLKKYISETYGINNTSEIEKICSETIIEPYIKEVLKNAILLHKKYPHLKTIRLDTNDGFFKQMKPYLDKFGFHPCRENELLEELKAEFKEYNLPYELEKLFHDYPDRKNSVTIHFSNLEEIINRLEQEETPKNTI